ncbi:MAG: EF-P beta-lysylation protein EpmB, partial [Gammaproteobacteria bacterium]
MRDKAAYDTLKPMAISSWQQELRAVIREPQELLDKTGQGSASPALAEAGLGAFPLRVPESYLRRIARGQTNDPLLRQVLPLAEEDIETPGYSDNPVGEFDKTAAPGLIRKYPGRVLLITTSVCAIHCRYCFRRHYPYNENNPARENWMAALETIRADQSIREVILSGGDPLTLGDAKLSSLIRELEAIPHLQWLRIHTRMPVVIPARITGELVEIIAASRFKQTVVIHANHPSEIDTEVAASLSALHYAGIQLLNQSVLLRGVNDDVLVLTELSERLYANHVLPYYLHMLDPVAG